MLGLLRCLWQPHRPDMRRVTKTEDGQYRGYCTSCGAPIRRLKRGLWKRTWRPRAPSAQG